jgi:hypothetical protein
VPVPFDNGVFLPCVALARHANKTGVRLDCLYLPATQAAQHQETADTGTHQRQGARFGDGHYDLKPMQTDVSGPANHHLVLPQRKG